MIILELAVSFFVCMMRIYWTPLAQKICRFVTGRLVWLDEILKFFINGVSTVQGNDNFFFFSSHKFQQVDTKKEMLVPLSALASFFYYHWALPVHLHSFLIYLYAPFISLKISKYNESH